MKKISYWHLTVIIPVVLCFAVAVLVVQQMVSANREINCASDFSSCNGLQGYWKMNDVQYDDDFTGTTIDTSKWIIYGTSPTQNGTLNCASPASTWSKSGVYSQGKMTLHGDFDIQVDFNRAGQVTPPSVGVAYAEFIVQSDSYYYLFANVKDQSGAYRYTSYTSYGAIGLGESAANESAGKLRITRTGSTIRGYRWTGSAWSQYATQASGDTSDMHIQLIAESSLALSSVAAFDNLIVNSGGLVADSSGQGNSGSINGANATTGKLGNGLVFDGINDYASISDSVSLSPSYITVSAWVNPTQTAPAGSWSAVDFLATKDNTGGTRDWGLYLYNANNSWNAQWGISRNGSLVNEVSGGIVLNNWTHIVGTYDGSYAKIYVNGELKDTSPQISGTLINSANAIKLGWREGADFFTGKIDEATIWNRALSEAEITQLYNLGAYPVASTFTTANGSTDFEAISNLSAVSDMKLANTFGSIEWTNNVNAANQDYDTNVRIGSGYVSINKTALDSSIDSAASVSINVSSCATHPAIYYATGYRSSYADIKANGQLCNATSSPACTNATCSGGVLSFDAEHFDSYAGDGSNYPPAVTSVNPQTGVKTGGTSITITGTDFLASPTVTIGGTPATDVVRVSETTITAVTPAHAVGQVNVVVTNSDTQTGTLTNGFTFTEPAPTVSSVSPTSGSTAGGTDITITGTNFLPGLPDGTGGTITTSGGYAIHTFTSSGTFSVPSGRDVEVLVVAGGGGGGKGHPAGGGSGGAGGGAGGLIFNSANHLTAGSYTVTVGGGGNGSTSTSSKGVNGSNSVFDDLTAVGGGGGGSEASKPGAAGGSGGGGNSGGPSGGAGGSGTSGQGNAGGSATNNPVYLLGSSGGGGAGAVGVTRTAQEGGAGGIGLAYSISGSSVYYAGGGGGGASSYDASGAPNPGGAGGNGGGGAGGNSSYSVCAQNGGSGTTNRGGGGGGSGNGCETSGGAGGSGIVIVRYLPAPTVTIGGITVTEVIYVNSTTLTATTPAHAVGSADVVVTNSDSGYGTKTDGFTFAEPPTTESVSPALGTKTGGTSLTITGTNFWGTPTVTFGGTSATDVVRVNSTTITATTPAHTVGYTDVVVYNPDNVPGTLTNGFRFTEPFPTVSLINPSSGSATGGTDITITGTNFLPGLPDGTGGTITTSGGYAIHTFTSSGTFSVPSGRDVEVLVVAGGGGGGKGSLAGGGTGGGGGGAGGLIYNSAKNINTGIYTVTVGGGGSGSTSTSSKGGNGSNSVFDDLTAVGGGGGGSQASKPGADGGSGGGAASETGSAGGSGTSGQGNAGGNTYTNPSNLLGASGGGGVGGVGETRTGQAGGYGGVGIAYSISGSSVYYAGGGGGGASSNYGNEIQNIGGAGGNGGGGAGGNATWGGGNSQDGAAGTTNRGGGGGGGGNGYGGSGLSAGAYGGTGSSGVVIIRYLPPPSVTIGGSPATNVTYISSTTITATTPAHAAGSVNVVVTNSDGGYGTRTGGFTYDANHSISSLSPDTKSIGSAGFTLTVNGSGFVSGDTVRWNGSDRETTFVNSGQLTAAILTGDLTSEGSFPVTVYDPAPGAGSSNAVNFPVTNLLPVATQFLTAYGSTDFPAVGNLASVAGMKLAKSNGSIQWTNSVNSAAQNYDNNVRIGNGFVSINKASLHSSIDASARVRIAVTGCGTYTAYYSSGFSSSLAEIKAGGQVCNSGTTPACTDMTCVGNVLSFDVPHFDGYGGEGSATPDSEGIPTTLDISNNSPNITATPSDGGSAGGAGTGNTKGNPTFAGSGVTFSATAKDINGDQYYLAVCRTDAVVAGDGAAPSCASEPNTWAVSLVTDSDSPASVTFTTGAGDAESNDWYAFVCDKVGGGGMCYPADGSGDQGSAMGTITFSDVPADGALLTIDSEVYELNSAGGCVSAPDVCVNLTAAQDGEQTAGAFASASSGATDTVHMTAGGNIVYVYTDTEGAGGNSIGMVKAGDTNSNVSLSGSVLAGGDDDNKSPFSVDHRPVMGVKAVTDNGGNSIEPGETVKFSAGVTDPDTVPAGDTVKLVVCSGDADMGGVTTAFVPGLSPSCTGGTVLCSSDHAASGTTASCTNATLVSVPTAHGTYNVKMYIQDNHYFADDGTANAKTYDVTDVAPVLTSYIAIDTPTPAAGGFDSSNFSVSLKDDNGDNDVTNIKGVFFDPASKQNDCTDDENDCYTHTSCSLIGVSSPGAGKTATGIDENLGADCTVTVSFNANASNWDVEAKATDGNGVTAFANAGVSLTIPALSGIDVIETEISYGTIVIGGTSPGKEISLGNVGNSDMDILVQGSNMCIGSFSETCPSTNIPISAQKWHMDDIGFDWDATSTGDGPYPLVASATTVGGGTGCANQTIRQRDIGASNTETNQSVYWKMRIPSGQPAGSYFGQIVLATTTQCVPEVCNNSTDDDGDGWTDCADHKDCDLSPLCSTLSLPMTNATHDLGNKRTLDLTANALHGVFGDGSTTTTFPTKLYTPGYSFDGGDWLTVPDSNSLDITNELTVALWIKINSIPTDYVAVLEKATTNADASYMFYVTPTTAKFRPHIYDAQINDWVYADTSLALTPNVWYHFVYTYKSSTGELKAYVDATAATLSNWHNSPVAGHTIKVSNSPLYIGKDTRGEQNLTGSVADVRIFNFAMDLKQINNLYQENMTKLK